MSNTTYQIFVSGHWKTLAISLSTATTVAELSLKIQDRTGIPPECQSLFHGGKRLYAENDPTVSSFAVSSGDTVILNIRMPPPQQEDVGMSLQECIELVTETPLALENLPNSFKNSKQIVRIAVVNDWKSLAFCSEELLLEPTFLMSLAKLIQLQISSRSMGEQNVPLGTSTTEPFSTSTSTKPTNTLNFSSTDVNFLSCISSTFSLTDLSSMSSIQLSKFLHGVPSFVIGLVKHDQINAYASASDHCKQVIFQEFCQLYLSRMYLHGRNPYRTGALIPEMFQTTEELVQVIKITCTLFERLPVGSRQRFELLDLVSKKCYQNITNINLSELTPGHGIFGLGHGFYSVPNFYLYATDHAWNRVEWSKAVLSSLIASNSGNDAIFLALLKIGKTALVKTVSFLKQYYARRFDKTFFLDYIGFRQSNKTLPCSPMSGDEIDRILGVAAPYLLVDPLVMLVYLRACSSIKSIKTLLELASPVLLGSKEFMSCLLTKPVSTVKMHQFTGFTFLDLDISLMKDPDIVFLFLQRHPQLAMEHAHVSLATNESFMKRLYLNLNSSVHLPNRFRLKGALLSLRKNANCLSKYAANISPFEVVKFASRKTISTNPLLATNVLAVNGQLLKYLPDVWKDDKAMALTAVKQCGDALQYVSSKLRQDRQVISMALRVRVPENVKFCLLMACMVPSKVHRLIPNFLIPRRTFQSLTIQDKRITSKLLCQQNKHLLRGRNLLCKIGGIGKPVLELIFSFAAWAPRREVRNILWNINYEVGKEWLDGEDGDTLYDNFFDAFYATNEGEGGAGDEEDEHGNGFGDY